MAGEPEEYPPGARGPGARLGGLLGVPGARVRPGERSTTGRRQVACPLPPEIGVRISEAGPNLTGTV